MQGFTVARSAYGNDEIVLKIHAAARMRAAAQDIGHGHWQAHRIAGKTADITIERLPAIIRSCAGRRQRGRQYGVGAQSGEGG